MERRKLLIGVGSLAAGSAVLTETGAFTSVAADRTVSVSVAGDDAALLALAPYEGPNGNGQNGNGQNGYAKLNNGQLQVNLDGNANAKGGGSGVNDNAKTVVEQVFTITNQGTQGVGVYLEKQGEAPGTVTFQTNGNGTQLGEKSNDPSPGATVDLTPGETVTVDIIVDTRNTTETDLLKSVTIYALASKFGGTNVGGGGPEYSLPSNMGAWSSALDGTTAAVGDKVDDEVTLYDVSNGGLDKNTKITTLSQNTNDDSKFGYDLALDNTLLAVGVNGASQGGTGGPGAYIYGRENGSWSLQQIEIDGTQQSEIPVGPAVAVDADTETVVVGNTSEGKIEIYEKNNSSWTRTYKTKPSLISFGNSVSISGTTVAVGAELASTVKIYEKGNSSWTSEKTTYSEGSLDFLGESTALNDDYLVVGANGENAVYVYEYDGGWPGKETARIAPDNGNRDLFGQSVAIDGSDILVGAIGANTASIFEREGNTWTQKTRFEGADFNTTFASDFGRTVALDGDNALVGASGSNGQTYLFQRE